MRRRLLTGLAVTAGALLALWLALDLVLAAVVRREGSRVLGAPVTLSLALVRPLAGQAQLRSLTVAQPLGFGEGAALSLERLTVRMAPRAAWRDPLVIDEVLVQGAFVRVELRDKRTNLQALHAHALAALATPPGAKSQRVVIRRLRVLGARASAPAPVPGRPRVTVPVKDLELRDVGGERGVTGAQLADLIARLMEPGLGNALRNASLGRILGDGAGAGGDKAKSGWQKIKGLFD